MREDYINEKHKLLATDVQSLTTKKKCISSMLYFIEEHQMIFILGYSSLLLETLEA